MEHCQDYTQYCKKKEQKTGDPENGSAEDPGNNSFWGSSAKSNYSSPSLAIAEPTSAQRPNQTGSHVPGVLALILLYLITFLRLQWLSFNKTQLTRFTECKGMRLREGTGILVLEGYSHTHWWQEKPLRARTVISDSQSCTRQCKLGHR